MKKENLKKIFELMFEKLESISVGENFINTIKGRRSKTFDKNKPDSFFYKGLVKTIHVSGFKVAILRDRWEDIKKAFSNYDINKVSQYTDEDLERMMNNPKIIRNKRKLEACIKNAKIMKEISDKHGSFGEYLNQSKDNPQELEEDLKDKFHFLGDVLVLDYLRGIGVDSIKPDTHVVRIMHRLNLVDSEEVTSDTINQVRTVADQINQLTGEKLSVIDAVFWIYGGGGDNHVEKAICQKNNPLCNECPLTEYCNFYKENNLK